MQRHILPFTVIFLLLLAFGCSSRASRSAMDRAEALIDSLPDSALTILRAIDPATLATPFTDEPRARHALLLSQALDKNGIDVADDSLITVAWNHYADPGEDSHRLAEASYYRAVTAFNASDFHSAVYYASIADTLAAEYDDYHLRGMANSLLALSYSNILDFEEQSLHARRSLDFFLLDNDSIRASGEMLNLAIALLHTGKAEEALDMLDNPLCRDGLYTRTSCLISLRRFDELKVIEAEHPEVFQDAKLLSKYARALIEAGDYDAAERDINRSFTYMCDRYDSISCNAVKKQLLKIKGDWQGYSAILEHELAIVAADLDERISASWIDGKARVLKFTTDRKTADLRRNKRILSWWLAGCALTCFVLCCLIFTLRSVIRRRESDYQLLLAKSMADFASLKRSENSLSVQLADKKREAQDMKERIDILDRQHRAIKNVTEQYDSTTLKCTVEKIKSELNEVCTEFNSAASDDNKARLDIKARIKAILTIERMEVMEYYVNLTCDNIVVRVRDLFTKKVDIDVIILDRLGFSNTDIALLLAQQSEAAVASRRTRIHNKLRKNG